MQRISMDLYCLDGVIKLMDDLYLNGRLLHDPVKRDKQANSSSYLSIMVEYFLRFTRPLTWWMGCVSGFCVAHWSRQTPVWVWGQYRSPFWWLSLPWPPYWPIRQKSSPPQAYQAIHLFTLHVYFLWFMYLLRHAVDELCGYFWTPLLLDQIPHPIKAIFSWNDHPKYLCT